MYESLKKQTTDFHLYIFAFDDLSYKILSELKLGNVTVISLQEFETPELLKVKPSRTKAEYCWTSTPSTISYLLDKYNLPNCTYIDADLYFYASPDVLINEMGENSEILVTEHRYTKIARIYEGKRAGRFCVQFLTVKNTPGGHHVLNTWKNQCIDWCYNRYEDGKFGDQKYLDNWPEKYRNIHILKHLGGGVAPWNIMKYRILEENGHAFGFEKQSGKKFQLVFYHFHFVKFMKNGKIDIGWHPLGKQNINTVYLPYIYSIIEKEKYLSESGFDYQTAYSQPTPFSGLIGILKWFLKNVLKFNYISLK
jgi:hypothetical protein